jgi:hypothetical protein
MDAELYKESIDYELLTQAIYEEILTREGQGTLEVKHDVLLKGKSGVEHQIDVCWYFQQAGLTHRVLIECKNFSSNLTLEKARNFFAVIHDIGNCRGIMVTKTGYQSGAKTYCDYYGIALKLCRAPTDEDWKGRIKTIKVNLMVRAPVSTGDRPIRCDLFLQATSKEQDLRLKAAAQKNPQLGNTSPSTQFLDKDGVPNTEPLRWWLPRQLKVAHQPDGGPYEQAVELKEHYLSLDLGGGPELVKVIGVKIHYWVETVNSVELVIDAMATVDAILKDFGSGEIEHVHRQS